MQEDLQQRLRSAASGGHTWARDILLARPCQIFPYLEGRTLWIIGDSMSKVLPFALTGNPQSKRCEQACPQKAFCAARGALKRRPIQSWSHQQCTLPVQDFAFAFQCFMLEFWDREDTGRWPKNPSLSANVSEDPALMQEVLTELSKLEPNQESNPWVSKHLHIRKTICQLLASFTVCL